MNTHGLIGRTGATGLALLLGGTLAVTATALAAEDSTGLAVDLSECVALESPEERFECYESRVGAVLQDRDSGTSAADSDAAGRGADGPPDDLDAPMAEAPAAGSDPAGASEHEVAEMPEEAPVDPAQAQLDVDAFGLRDAPRAATPPEELTATVAALRETVPNSYIITLDNGQVWRQMRPRRYPIRAGHEVRIYPSGWGAAFRMSVEELGGFIQVERVR